MAIPATPEISTSLTDVTVFCVAQIAAAVAGAIYEPVSRALMSDVCPDHMRLRFFSWRYLATNVGWGIGPLIGVAVGAASGGLFVAAGLAYAVFAAALVLTATGTEGLSRLDRPVPLGVSIWQDLRTAMRDPRLVFFLAGGTLLIAVHGQWSVSLSQYLTESLEDGVRVFAMLVSVNAVVVLVANRLSRILITRTGALPSLVLGCLLFLAGEIGFLVSGSLWSLTAAMVLFSLGEVLVVPAEYVLIDGISDDINRGSYFGAQALSSVGNFIGPTMGGMMLSAYGGPGMFLFFALLAALSAALFTVGNRMPPPSQVARHGTGRAAKSTGGLRLGREVAWTT